MDRSQHLPSSDEELLVLQYDKRRYDGGPEVELIQQIEATKAQYSHLQNVTPVMLDPVLMQWAMGGDTQSAPVQPGAVHALSDGPDGQPSNLMHVLMVGPVEIAVGLVGMLTAALALLAFSRLKNAAMVAQSRQVFSDCWYTAIKGVKDTLISPVAAARVVLGRLSGRPQLRTA